ncbi:amidase [Bryobacter aggregatus]|uniref:amidase n=1 Tax=Bryobacter aggregatus TaxID=360054 RepID=UPI000560EF31|nr:amidase [Bryobacter aggregatus]
MTLLEAAVSLRAKQVSSVELTTQSLERSRTLQSKLNAFLTFTEEQAFAQARQADSDFAKGIDHGPLQGIPVAAKDLFYTKGTRTTGGSKIFADFVPSYDSAVVERLRSAGAVLTGKLGMHELAFGITSNNAHYGAIRNPWDPARIPGGSSGGSGAAVSAGMVFAAMGSDTGGSIRIPASYCGTAGIKPTYGLVSRYGTMPLGFSLDHMGPLAQTSRDCAAVLNAIAGPDARDAYCRKQPNEAISIPDHPSLAGLRIAYSSDFLLEAVDPEIRAMVESALRAFHEWGATIVELKLGWLREVVAVSHVLLPAEAASVMEPHLGRREDFSPEVRPLFEAGRLIPAVDYLQAQKLRRLYRAQSERDIWSHCDILLAPSTGITAPKIGEQMVTLSTGQQLEVRAASTLLVRAFNVLGTPAHSVVGGFHSNGLPMSLQLIAKPGADAKVLHAGARFEEETGHFRRRPPL